VTFRLTRAGAYFVTYQSHILLEQSVVLIACAAGLPRDVFNFYMYYGTLGTFIEHCGYEVCASLFFLPLRAVVLWLRRHRNRLFTPALLQRVQPRAPERL
jgi:hypothetical protein